MYLYQYTDLNAVKSILKNQKLWATHVNFLNDSSEILHGIGLLTDLIGQERNLSKVEVTDLYNFVRSKLLQLDIFVSSLCLSGDELSMYRSYGNYALIFDRSLMVLALTVDGSSRQNSVIPCLYPNEYKDLDANSFELFHLLKLYDNQFLQGERDWFASSIIYSATSIKHPGFYYEKEQRAVVSLSKEDSTPILHRTRNNTEIPYLEMLIPINAIKGIYIGPSTNQDNARLEVFNFLAENNLEHIEIKTSSIPYVS